MSDLPPPSIARFYHQSARDGTLALLAIELRETSSGASTAGQHPIRRRCVPRPRWRGRGRQRSRSIGLVGQPEWEPSVVLDGEMISVKASGRAGLSGVHCSWVEKPVKFAWIEASLCLEKRLSGTRSIWLQSQHSLRTFHLTYADMCCPFLALGKIMLVVWERRLFLFRPFASIDGPMGGCLAQLQPRQLRSRAHWRQKNTFSAEFYGQTAPVTTRQLYPPTWVTTHVTVLLSTFSGMLCRLLRKQIKYDFIINACLRHLPYAVDLMFDNVPECIAIVHYYRLGLLNTRVTDALH